HLVQFVQADRKYTVAQFVLDAQNTINDIVTRGKTPIVVGGTGLYIDSLLKGIRFVDEVDNREVRKQLKSDLENLGINTLFERLRKIDPQAAAKIHINDQKRVMRALEVYYLHNKTKSQVDSESLISESKYVATYIGIYFSDRDKLYDRINGRVDKMLENGLLEEAKSVYLSHLSETSVQAIGHKEFFAFFEGKSSLDECIEHLKTQTRHYAKRQLTWFRKNPKINWIAADRCDPVIQALEILKNEGYHIERG
ncbi:MAG: tRNA (adenosine(37)-N6)-dimethylallyltransferase MiaA, partial [bacterium]|nr:tRNA (adenosine(37)-N6)-dimethylallyltransferase MiaA [bacterium]